MRLAQVPDLTALPMGAPAGPEGGAPAGPTFKMIYSPLDSLGKILADLDFKTFLQNNFGSDAEELSQKIWKMYGGDETQLKEGMKGKRLDKPKSNDPVEQEKLQEEEYNRTRESRWERLPLDKSIDEITTPEAITNAIIGGFNSLSKSFSKPATANAKTWLKVANAADKKGDYVFADKLLEAIKNVYSL